MRRVLRLRWEQFGVIRSPSRQSCVRWTQAGQRRAVVDTLLPEQLIRIVHRIKTEGKTAWPT